MDHSLLAGGFCTIATLFLVVESAMSKNKLLDKKFVFFYGAGCVFWALLGVVSAQVPLFMIGMIQFMALLSSYLIIYLGRKNATS